MNPWVPITAAVAVALTPSLARAACVVTLHDPPDNAVQISSPSFTWGAAGNCLQFRIALSANPAFPAPDRTLTPWQEGTRAYRMREGVWNAKQAGDWASGVYWKVQSETTTGVRTYSAFRFIAMDPDLDDDGYALAAGLDCDDSDATVHPGHTEVCDGLDNDCDATVDELDGPAWCEDADGDGYGDPDVAGGTCTAATWGFVSDDQDCDDLDPLVNPDATEVCADGDDNDCDGAVDCHGDGTCDDGSPTVACDGVNTGDGYDDATYIAAPLTAFRHVAVADGVIHRVEIFSGEAEGTSGVAIWDDDPALGEPGTVIGSGTFTLTPTNAWQGADLETDVALHAGQTYWVVWTPIFGAQHTVQSSGTAVSYQGSWDGGGYWDGPYTGYLKYQLYCCDPS